MRYLLLAVVMVALLSSACSSAGDRIGADGVITPASVESETYLLGQTVYNTQCASCHGVNGEGQFPDAPLKPDITGRYGAPPHNDTGHTWHHDDDLLIRIIREGGMGDPVNFYVMPALASVLSDGEIEAVIAYIKTMWSSEQQTAQRERTLAVRAQEP
jgi:mono/diheme cytochrome c family protein